MPALLIADIAVHDADTYREYQRANPDIVNRFGGRYVSLGGETEAFEGDWHPRRVVVIEFPDMATVRRFYASEEYAELRRIRHRSADSRLVAIETLPEPVERPG